MAITVHMTVQIRETDLSKPTINRYQLGSSLGRCRTRKDKVSLVEFVKEHSEPPSFPLITLSKRQEIHSLVKQSRQTWVPGHEAQQRAEKGAH